MGLGRELRNRWGIPSEIASAVLDRDRQCIYCGVTMHSGGAGLPRREAATWEHIVNDARIVTLENIARCCAGCNASKGARSLADWLASRYCQDRGITEATIAPVARAALRRP